MNQPLWLQWFTAILLAIVGFYPALAIIQLADMQPLFYIGKYSPILLVVGFIFLIISKSSRINNVGKVILYFGVLFFGL